MVLYKPVSYRLWLFELLVKLNWDYCATTNTDFNLKRAEFQEANFSWVVPVPWTCKWQTVYMCVNCHVVSDIEVKASIYCKIKIHHLVEYWISWRFLTQKLSSNLSLKVRGILTEFNRWSRGVCPDVCYAWHIVVESWLISNNLALNQSCCNTSTWWNCKSQ